VERWLRAEAIQEDVLTLLDDLGELTPAARAAVSAVGRVNAGGYRADLIEQFPAGDVARLYALNPVWAATERRVYGELPVD
jgi:hypothetical protein